MTLQLEPLPDEIRNTPQDFSQITSGFSLDDDGDHKKFEVRAVDSLQEVLQGIINTDSEIDFIQSRIEFSAYRVIKFVHDHLQPA